MADDASALAIGIRAGDPAAEATLVERYRPGIAMILRRLVKDAALADDLTQEVFRIAFESLRAGRLEDGSKLAAYIWGITRNVGHEALRRHRPPVAQASGGDLLDTRPRPDQALLAAEREQRVRDAVRALLPRDRAVLEAFYLEDQSKDSICRRLGLAPAQFDVIKWRALKRLRLLVGQREDL
ncbi:MAG: sigma-70 family RNA polymerase sigma factor [Acidobacteriota bacterium]